MKIALLSIGGLLMLATAIPIARHEAWWVRIFDFPRAQILLLAIATLAGFLAHVEPIGVFELSFLAALSACIFFQCRMIYPYTPLAQKQTKPSMDPRRDATLRLLFANVLMTNRNTTGLQTIIRDADPDIVLALETDAWWLAALKDLERAYPHTVYQPQDNTYGMLLFSKLALENTRIEFLVDPDVPSIHTTVRMACGQPVDLHCVHPRPPFLTTSKSSVPRDAELLIVGKRVQERTKPVIVLGDLNDVAWSRTTNLFQKVSRLLDPRIGRGFYNTFNANNPLLRFPLDHFFHSEDFKLLRFGRLRFFGSDHFPVFIELSYEPAADQDAPHARRSEQKQAQKKIEKARA